MRKTILVLFFIFILFIVFCMVAHANPDGPKFVSPYQYREYKIGQTVLVQWNAPDAVYGEVDHYVISARRFELGEDVNASGTGTVIIYATCDASIQSYIISGTVLENYYFLTGHKYRKYRIAICAVMKNGISRWSDPQYFYISTNNTPVNQPISFRIYNGFVAASKSQVYYACQNWNNQLNIGREIVNTYPYSQGTDLTGANTSDGINIVTEGVLEQGSLMATYKRLSYNTATMYKLAEADIVVNQNVFWTNSPQGNAYYFYNTIMHEVGHIVGLSDKYDSWASEWTMYGYSEPGESKKVTLESQDIIHGRGLY